MIEYDFELHSAETAALRELYVRSCAERGVECKWPGKMNRNELMKKLEALVASGDIGRPERSSDQEVCDETDGARGIRRSMNEIVEDCFQNLLEALRLYVMRDAWIASGKANDPQAAKYLKDARECVRKAVGATIGQNGTDWDRAIHLMTCVDRALLKMRVDFSETVASNCVMSALMSDEHQARMEAARHG